MKTGKTTQVLAGFVGLALLAACGPRDTILTGTRFDVGTPLQDVADGQALAGAQNKTVAINLPAAANLGEWAQTGGNARHSLPHGALSANPSAVWSVKVGAGNTRDARIAAAPVVAGHRVFAVDQAAQVTALAASNGAVLWQSAVGSDAAQVSGGGLAVAADRLFVAVGAGDVVALDVASGAEIWRQHLASGLSGAPLVEGNSVYVIARDGSATALNMATGRIEWTSEGLGKTAGVMGAGSAASDGGMIYLPFAGGQIQAMSADGTTQWQGAIAGKRLGRAYAGFGDVTGDPVVANGVVYVGSSAGRMVALESKTGLRIWSADEGAMNAPLVAGGSVFVVNDQSRLVRLDARDGTVIWGQQMPYFGAVKPKRFKAITPHYGPVLAGGQVIVASGDGTLRLFDPASGQITGQVDIPSGAAAAPVLAEGMMFVIGQNGQLHAFR